MEKKKMTKVEDKNKEKDKNVKSDSLPPCTLASSAEHYRAHDDDEPCDDGRTGLTTEE